MRVRIGVVPPDGWHYQDASQKRATPIIRGETFDDLVAKVIEYRSDNQLPLGDPQRDVENYICGNWPHFCFPVDSTKLTKLTSSAEPPERKPLIERMTQWIANRYANLPRLRFVEPNEARRRASICARCPANTNWKTNCAPCVEKVDRHSRLLRPTNATSTISHDLLACRIAGHDNRVAVWMDEQALRHRKHYKLPKFCWMNGLKSNG